MSVIHQVEGYGLRSFQDKAHLTAFLDAKKLLDDVIAGQRVRMEQAAIEWAWMPPKTLKRHVDELEQLFEAERKPLAKIAAEMLAMTTLCVLVSKQHWNDLNS